MSLYRIVLQRGLLLRNIRLLLRLTPVFTAPSALRRGRVAFCTGARLAQADLWMARGQPARR